MAEYSEREEPQISNRSREDFDDFCKNFPFLDTATCWHCNGFCGPNLNQPLCVSCHKFIFSTRSRKRLREDRPITLFKYFRHGHSRVYMLQGRMADTSSPRTRPQLKDLNAFFGEIVQNQMNNKTSNGTHKNSENKTVEKEVQACSSRVVKSEPESDTHISVLPVEMLLKIFSQLNDITLLQVSKVSQQWKQILDTQQDMWKRYTKERWPLLQRKTETSSWLKMYTALDSSCCCNICTNEMMEISENSLSSNYRLQAERDEMSQYEMDGIRAVPLDRRMLRWQASIVGPRDSPYEGGTFFLYLNMTVNFPFKPPIIRFLTKIIHPNISRHGDIGLDILTWNYCSSLRINRMLLSIQSILCDPYTKVCMEPELGRLYDQDRPRFDALARDWTKKYAMMDEISFDN